MKVAILDCDFIGLGLSKFLNSKGDFVTATTRNSQTLQKLDKITQKSFLSYSLDKQDISLLLNENDTIILTSSDKDYKRRLHIAYSIKSIAIEIDLPKTLIFTSKSLLYGDHQGLWVDESASLNIKNDQLKFLMDTESTLFSLKSLGWRVTILRCAKVYGPNKQLSESMKVIHNNFIAGDGSFYTNMVNEMDIIGAIDYVINHNLEGYFNVVDDDHQTRQQFTDMLCERFNLPRVTWDPQKADFPDSNKRVSNYRIKEKGFILQKPHREL